MVEWKKTWPHVESLDPTHGPELGRVAGQPPPPTSPVLSTKITLQFSPWSKALECSEDF